MKEEFIQEILLIASNSLLLVVSIGKRSAASEVYMWKMFLCHLGSIVDG